MDFGGKLELRLFWTSALLKLTNHDEPINIDAVF